MKRLPFLTALGVVLSLAFVIAAPQLLAQSDSSTVGGSAVVPRLVWFVGALKDADGKPINGAQDVTFSLYAIESGGEPLWFETQTVEADALGRYSVLLGAMHPDGLPIDLFTSGEARWLGVAAGNLPEQPRVLLVSVPYALKAGDAETLGGKPASAYLLAVQDPTGSGTTSAATTSTRGSSTQGATGKQATLTTATGIAPALLTGTQNYIPVLTDNSGSLGNSAMYQYGSNIGLGTKWPTTTLHVSSDAIASVIAVDNGLPSQYSELRFYDQGWSKWRLQRRSDNAFTLFDDTLGNYLLFSPAGTGRLGIGTTAPTNTLQVSSNTIASVIAVDNGLPNQYSELRFYDQGWSKWRLQRRSDNAFTLFDDTLGNYLLFSPAGTGRLGIGTTTPAATLEVNGTAKFNGAVTLGSTITGNGSGLTNVTASGLTCTGCVDSAKILDGTIITNDLALSSIESTRLADGAVTATKIANGAVGFVQLSAASVGDVNIISETIKDWNISPAAAISASKLALAARTRGITYLAGCDTCAPLADINDQRTIYFNLVGAMTINSITCFSDAGTPTINIQRDDGTPANILWSDLSCSAGGSTSTLISGPEGVLNMNDKLDFVMMTAGGLARRVTVVIRATLN